MKSEAADLNLWPANRSHSHALAPAAVCYSALAVAPCHKCAIKLPSNAFRSSTGNRLTRQRSWPPSQLYRHISPLILRPLWPRPLNPFIWSDQRVGDRAAGTTNRQRERRQDPSPQLPPHVNYSLVLQDGGLRARCHICVNNSFMPPSERKGRFSSQQSRYLLWDVTPLWGFDVFPLTWTARSDERLNSGEVTEALKRGLPLHPSHFVTFLLSIRDKRQERWCWH